MTENSRSVTILFSAIVMLLCTQVCLRAQAPTIAGFGLVSIDAADSEFGSGYLIYHYAHAKTKSGATLDADELKAVGASATTVETVTATGHVHAVIHDLVNKRTYTMTSDVAVYDPSKDKIDLTGNVKVVVDSSYTDGPLVQTGTAATVFLGTGPDFPKIDMHQVHTEFTVKQ